MIIDIVKSKDIPHSFGLIDMADDFVCGSSNCFIIIKDEGAREMKATFNHGDTVVIYDDFARMTGIKEVATIDYWIKANKYKKNKIETKYEYLYFVLTPTGKHKGPYRQEDLLEL